MRCVLTKLTFGTIIISYDEHTTYSLGDPWGYEKQRFEAMMWRQQVACEKCPDCGNSVLKGTLKDYIQTAALPISQRRCLSARGQLLWTAASQLKGSPLVLELCSLGGKGKIPSWAGQALRYLFVALRIDLRALHMFNRWCTTALHS